MVRFRDITGHKANLNRSMFNNAFLPDELNAFYARFDQKVGELISPTQTAAVGHISNNDETEYRKMIESLVTWCKDNNLYLNVSKTKELVINFRKEKGRYTPIYINGAKMEVVESFKFLGVNIANNLSWFIHIDAKVKKARQCLYFLR
eukprot:g42627.t1